MKFESHLYQSFLNKTCNLYKHMKSNVSLHPLNGSAFSILHDRVNIVTRLCKKGAEIAGASTQADGNST